MAKDSSHRLDNVGKFYSAQAGHTYQTVFRIAAEMADDVDPAALQRALDQALDRFPGFNVTLRSGLFWHYFEQAPGKPAVQPEDLPPCAPMHAGPESALIRVSYFRRRINVEVSHMVSDGRGTMEFFKTLVGLYVRERHGCDVELAPYARDEAHKTEDSFSANYERAASASTQKPKAYRIHGWRDEGAPKFMEVHLPSSEVYAAAKRMGVGVTALLIAAIVCSIRDGMPEHERRKGRAICINVPVDLRRFFGSETLRNFFGLAFVSYVPGESDEPLAAVAQEVARQLGDITQPEALKKRMNRMVKLQKNPLLRVAPVFLKDAVLGLAARIADRDVTTTASNLGRVEMPQGCEPYVRSVVVLTSTTGVNFVMSTYGDDLSVGVSSVFVSDEIPRRFVEAFEGLGIAACVNVTPHEGRREGFGAPAKTEGESIQGEGARREDADAALTEGTREAIAELAGGAKAPGVSAASAEAPVAPACSVESPFPKLEHFRRSRRAQAILGGVTLVLLAAIVVLCIVVRANPWRCVLACAALVVNYAFVRNMVVHSPDVLRLLQRYYLVLVAMAFLWFFATWDPSISTLVIPCLCITGTLFNAVLLAVFRSRFLGDYAKYLLFVIVLGVSPVALFFTGTVAWPAMPIISAAFAVLFAAALAAFAHKQVAAEARKLFDA